MAGQLAGGEAADDVQRDGRAFGRGGDVGGSHRVAVHGGVVERRNVAERDGVFRQNLPQRLQQRAALRAQRREMGEDALQRFLHAQHRLIVMAPVSVLFVSVFSHGHVHSLVASG